MKRFLLPLLSLSCITQLFSQTLTNAGSRTNSMVSSRVGSSLRISALFIALIVGLIGSSAVAQTVIQIGTGISNPSVGTSPGTGVQAISPMGCGNGAAAGGKKWQGIYTAAMINTAMTNAGFTPGAAFVNTVGFNITGNVSASFNHVGYTIKLANVAQADLSGGYYTGAMSTVFGPTNQTFSGTGWFSLSTSSFTWDGSSNLCIEVCYTHAAVGGISTYGGCQFTPVGGNNRMGHAGGSAGSCAVSFPGTGSLTNGLTNVRLTVSAATPCSGSPTLSTAETATTCPGVSTNLSLTGLAGASGYTYLWKYSSNIGGPYTAAAGTNTNSTYDTPATLPSSPAYYKCEVTCTNSGLMTASNPGTVTLANFLTCYCTGTYAAANAGTRGIVNVGIAAPASPIINNASAVVNGGAGATSYTSYTAASPVANAGLTASLSYVLAVKVGTQAVASNYVGAWIDYNQNGTFETSEFLGSFGPVAASTTTNINFTVPGSATPGSTAMRVRHRYGGTVTSSDACTNFTGTAAAGGAGETEDYRVTILAGCVAPSGATASSAGSISTTSAAISWTNGSGTGGRLVLLKQGAAVNDAPTSGTSYTDNLTFGSGSQIGTGNYVVYDGTASTTGTISGLLPSTTYYYSIYEYNTASTCYVLTGTTGNFTTASCSPTVQPTLLKACPEYTKMYVDVTRGNGTNILIVARDGAAVNADPAYNATYSASAAYGFGTQIGSGNYVVYNGSAAGTASFVMTNVNPGVTYHFKAYEYNASPNCYNLVAPATFSSTARSAGVYTSSTTTQVTTTTQQGTINQQVVSLNVNTAGGLDVAATINSITFTTTGTTTASNLRNARIFYTGNSATFSDATQFGNTIVNPSGTHVVSGNFKLLAGANYFWVAYDLTGVASLGNVIDATIPSFNLTDGGGTSDRTPTTIAPAGSRTITSGSYCTASSRPGCASYGYSPIPTFAGYTYNYTCSGNYQDLTGSIPGATVTPGSTYSFSSYVDDWIGLDAISAAWVDWNQNNVFDHPSERIAVVGPSGSVSVTVPIGAIPGVTRMRVYMHTEGGRTTNPCQTGNGPLSTSIGHIIDVRVNVTGTPPVGGEQTACPTLAPSVTTPIAYTQGDATSALTATGTSLKWYSVVTGGTSTSAPTPSSANAGTTMYYVSQTTGGCEGPRTQIAVNVIPNSCVPPLIWEGDESSDWNTGGNWSTGVIPTVETDVTINPVSSPNMYPIISGTNGVCNNFTINSVAPLSIAASYSLVINGNVSTSVGTAIAGAGTVHMNGTAAQTLTGNVTYPILRIDNTAGVSVASGTQTITLALELKNGVFTTNNTVTLRSTSAATAYLNNFSATFTGSLSGDITVQRYLAGGLGYRYFSSPFTLASGLNVTNLGAFVTGTNGLIFDPTAINSPIGFPTCWIYNENDANATESPIAEWGWVSATNASNPLTPMQGFALNLNGNATISLTGTPSNGVVTPIAISNTPSSNPIKDGYNLVGNPYPSPISWNALRALPANAGEFTNVIQFWSNSGQYTGQYAYYNGSTYANTGADPDFIPLGQSFMVHRTAAGVGNMEVNNTIRRASSSNQFYDAEAIPNLLRLRISGGSGNDEMVVYFTGEASNNYDENHDAVKSLSGMPGIPNIYSVNNTMILAINAMGNFVENMEIPLGMYIMTAGNYTVLATEYESFEPTSMLYLEDRSTGTFYNLRAQSSLTFTLPAGDISGRFFLRFHLPLEINANAETCVGADGNIVVNNPSGDTWNVSIANEAGVMVENSTISTSEFTSSPLAAGNYAVRVQSADNFAVNLESSVYPAPVLNAAFATSASTIAANEVVLFTCTAPNTFSTYTWLFGDGTSASGTTSVSHTYANTGIYEAKLKVSYENCDEIHSQSITVQNDATGILDVKQGGITVFPNPAVDMITVKYDTQEDLEWISIYDASGRLIQTEYVSGMFSKKQITLPVRELSNGMYFMTLKSAQNAHTVRFNIQK